MTSKFREPSSAWPVQLIYLCDQPIRLPDLDRKVLLEFARPVDRLFIIVAGDDEQGTHAMALVVDCVQPIFSHAPSHPVVPESKTTPNRSAPLWLLGHARGALLQTPREELVAEAHEIPETLRDRLVAIREDW